VGANIVAGRDPEGILRSVETMLRRDRNWENPFGEDVSRKIVRVLQDAEQACRS